MKKVLLSIFLCFLVILTVNADNFPNTKYKNIKVKEKISYNDTNDTWTDKTQRKETNYFIKTKGFGDFYDYLDPDGNFAFSTNCEYEFIYNNNLIGYSNSDMKFYEITYIKGGISKRELSKEEVEKIFPEYKVIALSDFNQNTNSYKIKKHLKDLKIILLNDTNNKYEGYKFASGNAKFEQYSLRGFIDITKEGMIQFAGEETNKDNPIYVLLVR